MGCGTSRSDTSVKTRSSDPPDPPKPSAAIQVDPPPSKTTVTKTTQIIPPDVVANLFGARPKQSAYSKRVNPQDLEFIEHLSRGETEQTPRTGSRETQKTVVSTGSSTSTRLPPIGGRVTGQRKSYATLSRTAVSLPNVVGTPGMESRSSVLRPSSLIRRSWSVSSEEEIVNHRRPSSAGASSYNSSVPNSAPTPSPQPEIPPLNISARNRGDRKSISSEASSFVVVRHTIRVAWEDPRRRRRRKDDKDEDSSEPNSSFGGSCSTCEPSPHNYQSETATDSDSSEKITVLPPEPPKKENSDAVSKPAEEKSRTSSALARLKQLRQLSLHSFVRRSFSPRTTETSTEIPQQRKRFFRSKTLDLSSIKSRSRKNSVSPAGRRVMSPSGIVSSISAHFRPKVLPQKSALLSESEEEDHLELDENLDELGTEDCPRVFHEFFNNFPDIFDDELLDVDIVMPIQQITVITNKAISNRCVLSPKVAA